MNKEWLDWLKVAHLGQLMESLSTRQLLLELKVVNSHILEREIRAIRQEIKRRNG